MGSNHNFEVPLVIELDRCFADEPEQLIRTTLCASNYVEICYLAAETISQIFHQLHEIYDDLDLATMTCSSSLIGFDGDYCFAGAGYGSIPSRAAYEFSKAMNGHFGIQVNHHASAH